MDPYHFDPVPDPSANPGPNGSPSNPGPGYTPGSAPGPGYMPGPETSRNIGYPPPGAQVPPAQGPYPPGPGAYPPGPSPYPAGDPYQGGYAGMPPQYAPVPPPSSGMPVAGWIGIALGVVLLLGLGITGIVLTSDDDDDPGTTTADPGGDGGGGGSDATSNADPTEDVVADPVAEAVIGDCFYNYGDETTPELETAVCGAGAFEAVDIIEGTSDLTSCDSNPVVNLSVTSTGTDRVLCLSYTVIDGDDAYHAQVGECVYGTSTAGSAWYVLDCQDGAFKVIERIDGESSTSSCTDSTYYIYGVGYSTGETYLDTTLCLQMLYASGDTGYAEVDDCLSMNSDYTYAEFVSDCDDGNAYVTGRTNEIVDGESWCNGWGWAYEEVPDFPELSFTVCWGWL
ncbi:LppU/SCO3897 family protein [Glycomyces artemisiae]|uniref:Uncharacterized protein n=1 Tax=Glycomyces artemisiae TaxID=1076443 RepID=A0A2T0USK9_9ACTN|nr:hypothetical protein [Glycomyces artemisiae]PRY60896.1 hypothetical protein B0I28_102508 [Glycomyces artemisiae]